MIRARKIIARCRRSLNYAGNDLASLFNVHHPSFQRARGARILCYHGICKTDHTRFNNIFLKQKTFEAHLQFYKRHFNVISLDDFYQQRFSRDRFNVCLSFDDGYENNHSYVLPLLKRYKLPAVFFLTAIREAGYDILWNDFLGILGKYGPDKLRFNGSRYLKRHRRYESMEAGPSLIEMLRSGGFEIKAEMMKQWYPLVPFRKNEEEQEYWRQLSETQIRELSRSPWVTIGCHGYYHNDLARIPIADARDEMTRSRSYLQNITGREISALAFPYGTYTPSLVSAAKELSFTRLLALDFHFPADRTDPFFRERLTVNPFISVSNQMLSTIKGNYDI